MLTIFPSRKIFENLGGKTQGKKNEQTRLIGYAVLQIQELDS